MSKNVIILICFLASSFGFGQQLLFKEDFNSCQLSDKWTVDIKGNQNVAWAVGLPVNPKANGTSIDGSCMLVIDDDLTGDKTAPFIFRCISDYFSTKGFSELNFKAQVHFRRDKTESFRIIVDNGQNEFIVREFKGSNYSGEFFDQNVLVNADLSFYASDSLRIIFEYDDNNEFAWWAGVDNIEVTGSAFEGEILLGQTFNDCVLPSGWSTEIVSGVNDWQFNYFNDGKSMDGSCFVYFNDDVLGENAPLSKIRLKSPVFKASEYAYYKVSYDFIFRVYEPSEYLTLFVDNGKEWIPVKTYNGDFGGPNVDQNKKEIIDLSAFKSDSIRLIWEYYDGGWGWWLGFDNIKVIGYGQINDRCTKASALSLDQACQDYDNTIALKKDEFNVLNGLNSGILYYTFMVPENGNYQFRTKSAFNDHIEVLTGNCNQAQILSAINKDEYGFEGEQIAVEANAGQTLIIRVYGSQAEFGLDHGQGCISVLKKTIESEPNQSERCNTAIPLVLNESCIKIKNIDATLDGPIPLTNQRSRADVWYSFTPMNDGDYDFYSQAQFADVIALYEGDCNEAKEVISNYNGQSLNLKNAKANQTYYFQITGYFALLEGQMCAEVKQPILEVVENKICSEAIQLNLNQVSNSYDNIGAGFSGIQPKCDAFLKDDVWFTVIAPTSGKIYVQVKASFEHVLAVYEGNCGALTSVYCDDGKHHCLGYVLLDFLDPGKKYFIQIGSKVIHHRYHSGSFSLDIQEALPEYTPLALSIEQSCVSRGAVKFIPTSIGGKGNITYGGQGLVEAVPGNSTYIIEAKDEAGCIHAVSVNAVSCNDFGCSVVSNIITTNVSCFGRNDGQASISVQGGLEPYNYQWSNGHIGYESKQLTAGMYTVTISDGSGCELVESFRIDQSSQIDANAMITPPSCHDDATGKIALFTIGGSGGYNYLWSNNATTDVIEGLMAGNYNLTITDASSCSVVQEFKVESPDPLSISGNKTNVACYGDKTGSITMDIKGGTKPYNITWSNNISGTNVEGLEAGSYTAEITDANGCIEQKVYEILQPELLVIQEESVDLIFSSAKQASIQLSTSGGTPPYTYEWFADNVNINVTTEDINPSADGLYFVNITDANLCNLTSQAWEVTRSTSTLESAAFGVWLLPNPATTNIEIFFDSHTKIQNLKITDLQGKTVYKHEAQSIGSSLNLDVSQWNPAPYLLLWEDQNGRHAIEWIKIE